MSPEQARGENNLAPQSDQFSFGLVLYELANGKRAFERGSAAETMTAIIREDAEPLPGRVPAPLRWAIERLLAKQPSERYDSTRDLYRELKQIRDRLSQLAGAETPAVPFASGWKRGVVPGVVALACLAAGSAFTVFDRVIALQTIWLLMTVEGISCTVRGDARLAAVWKRRCHRRWPFAYSG